MILTFTGTPSFSIFEGFKTSDYDAPNLQRIFVPSTKLRMISGGGGLQKIQEVKAEAMLAESFSQHPPRGRNFVFWVLWDGYYFWDSILGKQTIEKQVAGLRFFFWGGKGFGQNAGRWK